MEYIRHLFDGTEPGISSKAARIMAEMTQDEAAEALEIGTRTLQNLEAGRIKKPLKGYEKKHIANVYNIAPELIKWPGEKAKEEEKEVEETSNGKE